MFRPFLPASSSWPQGDSPECARTSFKGAVGQAGAWFRSFPRVRWTVPQTDCEAQEPKNNPGLEEEPGLSWAAWLHSGAAVGVQKARKCVYFEPLNWFAISHLFVQSPDGFDTWPWTVTVFQSGSHVWLSVTPWPAEHQAHLSFAFSWSLLKLLSTESVMLPNHLILAAHFSCPQSFPASGSFPMRRLFASGGQSLGVSASASVLPINSQGWFPLGLTGLISLLSKGLSRVFSSTTVRKHQFFCTYGQHPYMTTRKIIALTIQTFEPTSLTSALADRFSTVSTTWEALWTALRTDESSFSFEKQINPKYLLMSCLFFWFTHL